MTTTASLYFGAINLMGTKVDLADNGWLIQAAAEGTDWDNPAPIDATVTSWLQDGAIIARSGYNNRPDMTISLRVTGVDANTLALAEQALVLETGKPNELVWTPPGVDAEPCVFSVVMSNLEHQMDDLGEVKARPYRVYVLRIQAEPFVRSQTLVSVTRSAPVGTQTITSVDACSSFTGWSASATGSGSTSSGTSGGSVFVTGNDYPYAGQAPYTLSLTRSGLSASLSTTPYVRVQVRVTGEPVNAATANYEFRLNGASVPVAFQNGSTYWLDATGLGTTLATVQVSFSFVVGSTFPDVRLLIDDVSRSNIMGDVGTKRQLGYTFPIAGSARTQASLLLQDGADYSLGNVLVYTYPSVAGLVQPNLRALRTSGPTQTADSGTVSGFYSDLTSSHVFTVPVTGLLPGGHLLVGLVYTASPSTHTFTWSTAAMMSGGTFYGSESGTTTVSMAAGYNLVTLAKVTLPTRQMGLSGQIAVTLQGDTNVVLDEAWLFNNEIGRITQADASAGIAMLGHRWPKMWLDSPSVLAPLPGLYMGTQADRSDQFYAGREAASCPVHEFVPPAMNVFWVTTESTSSSVTVSHHPRSHTHVPAAA